MKSLRGRGGMRGGRRGRGGGRGRGGRGGGGKMGGGDDDGDGYGDDMEVKFKTENEVRCVFALVKIQAANNDSLSFALFSVFAQLFKYISHGRNPVNKSQPSLFSTESSVLVVFIKKCFPVNGKMFCEEKYFVNHLL